MFSLYTRGLNRNLGTVIISLKLALVPFVNESSHRASCPHGADPQLKLYCIDSLRAKSPGVGPVYGRASEELAAGGPRIDVPDRERPHLEERNPPPLPLVYFLVPPWQPSLLRSVTRVM